MVTGNEISFTKMPIISFNAQIVQISIEDSIMKLHLIVIVIHQ